MPGRTLFQKIWDSHVVHKDDDGTTLLYIDRHLIHEVTSPQAFEGLRLAGRTPRRSQAMLAVPDHNVPTTDRHLGITDPLSRIQVDTLKDNCGESDIMLFGMDDIRQGIVHVIGPEQGFTLPGMTIGRPPGWSRCRECGRMVGSGPAASKSSPPAMAASNKGLSPLSPARASAARVLAS